MEREEKKETLVCACNFSFFFVFLVLSFIFQKVHHTSIFQRTQRMESCCCCCFFGWPRNKCVCTVHTLLSIGCCLFLFFCSHSHWWMSVGKRQRTSNDRARYLWNVRVFLRYFFFNQYDRSFVLVTFEMPSYFIQQHYITHMYNWTYDKLQTLRIVYSCLHIMCKFHRTKETSRKIKTTITFELSRSTSCFAVRWLMTMTMMMIVRRAVAVFISNSFFIMYGMKKKSNCLFILLVLTACETATTTKCRTSERNYRKRARGRQRERGWELVPGRVWVDICCARKKKIKW